MSQLREQLPQEQEERIVVFDSGGYSEANMKATTRPRSGGSAACQKPLQPPKPHWKKSTRSGTVSDGSETLAARTMDLPQGKERWIIVRTHARVLAAKEQMEKK